MAFEYQGEQHYNPIKIFDGEDGLARRKILDERKRKLCNKNGVKLMEWKYTKTISTKNLLDMLKTLK